MNVPQLGLGVDHPPLGGSCGIVPPLAFSGGETSRLFCPSPPPTITFANLCYVMVNIYALIEISIIIGTWVVGIDGHVPLIMEHIIKFQMGISKIIITFVCLLASSVFPLEKHKGLTHTNMEVQQSKVVIQSLLLSSSTFQLLDLLLTNQQNSQSSMFKKFVMWLIQWICCQITPLSILSITPQFVNHLILNFR